MIPVDSFRTFWILECFSDAATKGNHGWVCMHAVELYEIRVFGRVCRVDLTAGRIV